MSENENKAPENSPAVVSPPNQTPASPPTAKQKSKVKLKLIGAGSYRNRDLFMRKNEFRDFDAPRADELMKTGLFIKL